MLVMVGNSAMINFEEGNNFQLLEASCGPHFPEGGAERKRALVALCCPLLSPSSPLRLGGASGGAAFGSLGIIKKYNSVYTAVALLASTFSNVFVETSVTERPFGFMFQSENLSASLEKIESGLQ